MARFFKYIIILETSSLQTLSKNIETFFFIYLVGSVLIFGIFVASSKATFTKYLLKCLAMVMLSVTVLPLMKHLLLEEHF